MEKIKINYNKTKKNKLTFGLLLQSVVILFLAYYIIASPTPKTSIAQTPTFSEEITQDASICMNLQPEDRPLCAKIAGQKIALHTQEPAERLVQCLKFRPYFVHDCQLGLQAE